MGIEVGRGGERRVKAGRGEGGGGAAYDGVEVPVTALARPETRGVGLRVQVRTVGDDYLVTTGWTKEVNMMITAIPVIPVIMVSW